MGISLKDIFKPEHDELVIDKQKKSIKFLSIVVVILFFLIIISLVVSMIVQSNVSREKSRIGLLATDMSNLKEKILDLGIENRANPNETPLLGKNLTAEPMELKVNGRAEEYKYGYYMLTSLEVNTIAVLNLKGESYIVNYDTGEIVNINGIKYNNKRYYSLEDIKAISLNAEPISDKIINIYSADDLNKVRDYTTYNFKLEKDIDMTSYSSGDGWVPIEKFKGTFDGRGYTISSLTIDRPTKTNCGLFAEVESGATLKNITLDKVNINGGVYTGALVGYSSGDISNCKVLSGKVIGQEDSVGGLAGAFDKASMTNSFAKVSVNGKQTVGGLIGTLYRGKVSKCFYEGEVVGVSSCGGLIGRIKPSVATYLNESYAKADVKGRSNLGGLIGEIEVIDASKLDLANLYSTGAVREGDNTLGGSIGRIDAMSGAVLSLNNIYTSSDVLPEIEKRGGFIGETNITGDASITVNYCLWEKDVVLDFELKDVGTNLGLLQMNIYGKTKAEMMARITFAEWDFDNVWKMRDRETYPSFRWQIEEKVEEK